MAQAWHLIRRPVGMVNKDDFKLVASDNPPLGDGEVRVRNSWLSVDPAMRARMTKVEGYMDPFPLNAPLWGRCVGRVVESRTSNLAPGDLVFHTLGWRDESVGPAQEFTKLPKVNDLPDDIWLGPMGMPGATAYFGLVDVGRPKKGETLFVSAAAGSIGTLVVQMGKILGLNIIGSAGGAEKCALVGELGADAVIDYKESGSLLEKLKSTAPDGIDLYFDNVGADHLDVALACARPHARVIACGMIQTYNFEDPRAPVSFGHMMNVIAMRIRLEGFTIYDYEHRIDEAREEIEPWIREGRLRAVTTVTEGIETAADAFIGLFTGSNTGKALIKV